MSRILLAAVILLATGVLVGLLLVLWGDTRTPPTVDVTADAPLERAGERPTLDPLASALERIESLEMELASVRSDLDALRAGDRHPIEPPASQATASAEEREPRWYLDQYVASFEGAGRGSEYFRLAVQAYATALVDPICALVDQRARPNGLRAGLSAVLGDPRLAGNDRAVAALIGALDGDAHEVAECAVRSLREIAGPRHLPALLASVWRVSRAQVRAELIGLVLDLSGETPNAALARLMASAPDTESEAQLVALLRVHDVEGALELLGLASWRDRATRLVAAARTQEFRGDRTMAFVDEWASRESDPEVLRLLRAAREQLSTLPPWHAEQAVGAANAPDPRRDNREAWAASAADGGIEWIELGFQPAESAHEVRVHEVCTAGGLLRVTLIDTAGGRHVVWEGDDPLRAPGVLAIPFAATGYRVRAVRLEIDTARHSGWEEVDAVQLVGPAGVLWAATAHASSTYGQRAEMAISTMLLRK